MIFLVPPICLNFSQAKEYVIMQMYHILVILSSVEVYLGYLQFLAIMNKAAVNMAEQVSL